MPPLSLYVVLCHCMRLCFSRLCSAPCCRPLSLRGLWHGPLCHCMPLLCHYMRTCSLPQHCALVPQLPPSDTVGAALAKRVKGRVIEKQSRRGFASAKGGGMEVRRELVLLPPLLLSLLLLGGKVG